MKTESPFDILFQTLADITNPNSGLYKKMEFKPLKHSHGSKWDDCEFCDKEILQGKEIYIEHDRLTCSGSVIYEKDEVVIHHICRDCFEDLEFKEWLSEKRIKQVKNY